MLAVYLDQATTFVVEIFGGAPEDTMVRPLHSARGLVPNKVFGFFIVWVRQGVAQIELAFEAPAIHDPDKILIECLARFALCIGHAGMLYLNVDAGTSLDIGSMDFAIWRDVMNFSAVVGKERFPISMPLGFIFPPGIAVAARRMGPMVHDAWATFCDHRNSAVGQMPFSPGSASLRKLSTRANFK